MSRSNVRKQEQKYAQECGYKLAADISCAAKATDVTRAVGRLINTKGMLTSRFLPAWWERWDDGR
ncbi:MAG TPA: hypothetical protein VFB30_16220 [Spirochaetia bacterium]|nr:hypothetical protein [Spirochaetia bacterium]